MGWAGPRDARVLRCEAGVENDIVVLDEMFRALIDLFVPLKEDPISVTKVERSRQVPCQI